MPSLNDRPSVLRLRASLRTTVALLERGRRVGVSESDLRKDVCAVVDDLRSLEWPPERVIIAIKQIARETGLRPSRAFTTVSEPLESGDELLARVVRWCIEQYYQDVPFDKATTRDKASGRAAK